MRLVKYMADCDVGSRNECKICVKKGYITVNGEVVKDPSMQVTETDVVCYKEQPLVLNKNLYFMLNKPAGYVCATKDELNETVLKLFPKKYAKRLIIVGRLDKDTEGILLLTDDGAFSHRLTSPGKHVDKTYYFCAKGILPQNAPERVADGIDIGDDELTRPGRLTQIVRNISSDTTTAYLTIHEGRYHQVKRMVKALGCEVTYLKRIAIGNLQLDEGLEPGQYRALTMIDFEHLGM